MAIGGIIPGQRSRRWTLNRGPESPRLVGDTDGCQRSSSRARIRPGGRLAWLAAGGAARADRRGGRQGRASWNPAELPAGGDRGPVDSVVERYGDELAEQASRTSPRHCGRAAGVRPGRAPERRELIVLLPGADGPRGEIVARRVLDAAADDQDRSRRPAPRRCRSRSGSRAGGGAQRTTLAQAGRDRSAARAAHWTQTAGTSERRTNLVACSPAQSCGCCG